MKTIVVIALVALVGAICFNFKSAGAATMGMPKAGSVYDFTVKTIEDKDQSLGAYKGKVLLIVNTASQCGFTPQYKGLEAIYKEFKGKGFEVLAFPSNDFLGQEPGDNGQIKNFCMLKFKTTFPLFAKINVKGNSMAPLYQYLTTQSGFNGDISWNFNKFLVDQNGKVAARFGSKVEPQSEKIVEQIKKLLPK